MAQPSQENHPQPPATNERLDMAAVKRAAALAEELVLRFPELRSVMVVLDWHFKSPDLPACVIKCRRLDADSLWSLMETVPGLARHIAGIIEQYVRKLREGGHGEAEKEG